MTIMRQQGRRVPMAARSDRPARLGRAGLPATVAGFAARAVVVSALVAAGWWLSGWLVAGGWSPVLAVALVGVLLADLGFAWLLAERRRRRRRPDPWPGGP
jgi:Flp pilus assembly protein TadB